MSKKVSYAIFACFSTKKRKWTKWFISSEHFSFCEFLNSHFPSTRNAFAMLNRCFSNCCIILYVLLAFPSLNVNRNEFYHFLKCFTSWRRVEIFLKKEKTVWNVKLRTFSSCSCLSIQSLLSKDLFFFFFYLKISWTAQSTHSPYSSSQFCHFNEVQLIVNSKLEHKDDDARINIFLQISFIYFPTVECSDIFFHFFLVG